MVELLLGDAMACVIDVSDKAGVSFTRRLMTDWKTGGSLLNSFERIASRANNLPPRAKDDKKL